jgi:hypothetical protein
MKRTHRIASVVLAVLGISLLAGCGGPNLFERVGGFWGYGICGIIVVILDVLALLEIAGSSWPFGRKALWAVLIIFFPVGGLILYWFFAREAGA